MKPRLRLAARLQKAAGWPEVVTDALVRENDTSAECLKPSYYNHYTDTADPDKYVIFNKFWGSISVVATPVALAVRGGDIAAIPDDERSELEASGFWLILTLMRSTWRTDGTWTASATTRFCPLLWN